MSSRNLTLAAAHHIETASTVAGTRVVRMKYEGVSKSFRTDRLERELQMVQLSATRCSCIAILWVSLVSFASITLCVASERVFVVVFFFVIHSIRKLLDTPSYTSVGGVKWESSRSLCSCRSFDTVLFPRKIRYTCWLGGSSRALCWLTMCSFFLLGSRLKCCKIRTWVQFVRSMQLQTKTRCHCVLQNDVSLCLIEWRVSGTDVPLWLTEWRVTVTCHCGLQNDALLWHVSLWRTEWRVTVTYMSVYLMERRVTVAYRMTPYCDWCHFLTEWRLTVTDVSLCLTEWLVTVTDVSVFLTEWPLTVTDVSLCNRMTPYCDWYVTLSYRMTPYSDVSLCLTEYRMTRYCDWCVSLSYRMMPYCD
jgi:hypothetical protein